MIGFLFIEFTIILTDAMNMSTSSPIVNSGMLNDQKTLSFVKLTS